MAGAPPPPPPAGGRGGGAPGGRPWGGLGGGGGRAPPAAPRSLFFCAVRGPPARAGDFDQVLEYEAAYEKLSRRFPVATVCLYDARSHSGLETARLVQRHPDLFRHPIAQFVS